MSFSVEWDEKPIKFLNKLETDIVRRIFKKLKEVKEDPFRFLEHYEGEGYKLRIEDYRMIVDIELKKKVLTIQLFDKRGRIYK